jgi:hypothetical protein
MPGRAAAPTTTAPAAAAPAVTLRPLRELPRALGRAAGAGALQGGLLYGGAIALLHALHNRVGALDAAALLAWSLLLYGAAGAALGAVALLALRAARPLLRLRARAAGADASSASAPDRGRAGERELWLALAAFHALFWVLAASYGLTYDESPGWVRTAPLMLLWLLLRSLAVLGAALLASWLLLRLGRAAARHRRLGTLVAAAAGALLLAQVAVAVARPAPEPGRPPLPPAAPRQAGAPTKLAVIAIDGADWRVAGPLMAEGRLPTLARLVREGSWGPLASFPDSNSAVIWASIYSGREPADHGVLDFYTVRLPGMAADHRGVYPVHRTFFKELALRLQRLGLGELTPIDRHSVATPLLWEVAQAQGRSIGLVDGYFYSYPAPALTVAGSYFVGYGSDGLWQRAQEAGRGATREEAARHATPPELIAELGPLLGRPDFAWQSSALLRLLAERGQPELLTLYTHEPDNVQHEAWRWHEPGRYFGVDAREAAGHDRVARFYEQLDGFLAELRARLEPGTVLAVVSDHGHSPTIFHEMDTQHRHGPPGMLLLHGPGIRAGELQGAGVLDVYPTLLHLLGIPVPDDADGRLLAGAFDPELLAARPPRRVASWDGLPPPAPVAPMDSGRRREEIEKLRELGYIR